MNDARLYMNMVDDAVIGIEREQRRTGLTRAYRQELSWLAKEAAKAQKQAMARFTKEWEETNRVEV